jgi:hypothetical protein
MTPTAASSASPCPPGSTTTTSAVKFLDRPLTVHLLKEQTAAGVTTKCGLFRKKGLELPPVTVWGSETTCEQCDPT